MEIRWCPEEPLPGVVSSIRWDHADLQAALRRVFNESPRENLVRVDVEKHGLRAYFEPKNVGKE